jgi:tetratricopeptide (TPR) repeat protein
MNRLATGIMAVALFAPAALHAQKKPSDNMHTRSADVYLQTANKERVTADRQAAFQKVLEKAFDGIKAEPNNPKSYFQAGLAYVGLNDFIGADSVFDKAEALYPEYMKQTETMRLNGWITLYNAGVTALNGNNVAEAIKNLEAADAIYQKRPEALVTLGAIYMQQANFAKAETTLKKALVILGGPERAKVKADQLKNWEEDELNVALRLANMYADQKRNDEAEKVYRDLLKAQPSNTMAAANLATVLTRTGKKDEALAVYRDLLKQQDLSENTLVKAGIGLFTAQDYVAAADAFRRALTINPYAHATMYNLAQALFATSSDLEKQKAANPSKKAELDAQLAKLYEEMRITAEKLHGIDPTGRNVLMMLAQAQRSLGDLATGAAAEDWKRKALATLEKHKAVVAEVSELSVIPVGTEADVSGKVTNLTAAPGTPLKLRLTIVDVKGAELVSEVIEGCGTGE